MESTGGYENNWLHCLSKFQASLNLRTARLNPLGVSANSKADLTRNVTDKVSARSVAEYLIAHPEKVSFQQEDALSSLRKQWGFVQMLTKQKSQLLNQLESLCYSANPDLLPYCKDGVPQWILKLLVHYPTAYELSRAKASSLARIPYVSMDRANELIAYAKKSIASATDKTTAQLIVVTAQQILHLKVLIQSQTRVMAEQCSVSEIDLLKTFIGISDYSAIGLILEIQTVERFASVKKLAAFFGLNPAFKISGDGSSGFRMSKKGRKEPRRILYMAALSAVRSNPLIRDLYKEHTKRGMNRMAAVGLCMHKILRIIYGMLKHNKAFDPEIDRRNRQAGAQPKKISCKDKNRRYQDFDPKAPISRRQNRKRKEREQSHSDNVTEDGIITPVLKAP
jgi:transposase